MIDAYDLWKSHDAEQERQLEERPECCECGEYVQDDHYYLINDEVICPSCIENNYRKDVMMD